MWSWWRDMAEYKTLVKKIPISPDKKTKQKNYLKKGKLPIVDQGQGLIGGYTDDTGMTVKCDLPVIVFGDHTRAVKYVTFPFGAGADGIKVLQPQEGTSPLYLYYGTQYIVAKMPNRGYARHYQFVEKEDLPIPSIPEQERIVARIEELFSQLDDGVKTLKKTKAQLAVYRQAVLQEAFADCKERISLESVTQHITDGDHMPPPKADSGIPFIMISNVEGNLICWENTAHVGRDYYDNLDSKRKPQNGDVLYTVTGSYGIPVLVDYNKEFCFQRHIALLRPKDIIAQRYLYYSLMAPEAYAQATKGATGTAQKTVGLGVLRRIEIPFTEDHKKQLQIVEVIESRLSVCDSIEQTVDASLRQAEAMRQSILKDAFEGRL